MPPELTLTAGPRTDLFVPPNGDPPVASAAIELHDVAGDFQLCARVAAPLAATFDAVALVVWASPEAWGKLALERSPQGDATIVSVVTRGVSDDANAWPAGDTTWLRIARAGDSVAFHASPDGSVWALVRWFTFAGAREARAGFLVQSPTGEGLTGRFDEIAWSTEPLRDLRDGS